VSWQPGPDDGDATWPAQTSPVIPWQADGSVGLPPAPGAPAPRRRIRIVAFATLLIAGLCGLGVAAVGAAHQLLPRQFTAAQQRQIANWEMTRRWRALPAGKIFPAAVSYHLPGKAFDGGQGLKLSARRVTISSSTSCAGSLSASAARILARHDCAAVLRATYVDASGSLVATVGVAVLPNVSAARAVVSALGHRASAEPLSALKADGTLAGEFRDPQRQLSQITSAGPYVVFSTAGFTDGRHQVKISSDFYLDHELTSLASGLSTSARSILGGQPRVPTCPGAPGC
jgi:hypothetical protein